MASECSRKKIKLVSRLLKVGKKEALLVTKVDEAGGRFIDLSRKRVQPDSIEACEQRFNKALKVNNIAKQAAVKLEVELSEVYEQVVWPLAKAYGEESKAYDAFMIASESPDDVFSKIEIDPTWKEIFVEQIRKRMGAKELKIVARFELTCYS